MAFARITRPRLIFSSPLAMSHLERAIDSISHIIDEVALHPVGHPPIPTAIRTASIRLVFFDGDTKSLSIIQPVFKTAE